MKIGLLILLVVIAVAGISFAGVITRDGERVVPEGEGTIPLDAGDFEAFPLPDYAAIYVSDEYKSYFVEVEPGIKVHVLEVGSGFPVFLQHGNPTSGFLYRKVAEELPTDRVRVIMPTLVGLGFSSKPTRCTRAPRETPSTRRRSCSRSSRREASRVSPGATA